MKKLVTVLLIVLPYISLFGQTDKKSDEIDQLKKRVEELEKQLLALKEQIQEEKDDEALEKELMAEMSAEEPRQTAAPAAVQDSKNTNPAIGVIGNFLGMKFNNPLEEHEEDEEGEDKHGHGHGEAKDGFTFQEAEVSMQMVIDPYAKADFFVAVHPDVVELEEAYITLLSLAFSSQMKVGKFRSAFGKFNLIHTPELPFADYPLMLNNYFGEEGLIETGISLSTLVSNPWDQYVEVRAEISNGSNDISYNGDETNDLLYLGQLKTFFDLTDNTSLEMGFTGMTGVNDEKGDLRTNIGGINLSYRWKPLRYSGYRSFSLQAETLFSRREIPLGGKINSRGYFIFSEYQIARRWFLGGRYDYAEAPGENDENETAFSGFLTFWPSEFQAMRFQYRQTEGHDGEKEDRFIFQWSFIIGKHGAHIF